MDKRKVILLKKVEKTLKKLPKLVRYTFFALAKEIEEKGPVRGNWPNYGKLSKTKHHCHIKKGQPTYVACWEERNGNIEIEVYYVGTHEKAPY